MTSGSTGATTNATSNSPTRIRFRLCSVLPDYGRISPPGSGVGTLTIHSGNPRGTVRRCLTLLACRRAQSYAAQLDPCELNRKLSLQVLRTVEITRANVDDLKRRDEQWALLVRGKGHDRLTYLRENVDGAVHAYLKARGCRALTRSAFFW
jgi:hypothetical protein